MESDSQELRAWIAAIANSYDDELNEGRQVWQFPNDSVKMEFIDNIHDRTEGDIHSVLSKLLIPSCALGLDSMNFDVLLQTRSSDNDEFERSIAEPKNVYWRRIFRYFSGLSEELPWEGITWIAQLLPGKPRAALRAIDAFFEAHMWHMSDSMIFAISDAEDVIRARYIQIPEGSNERIQYLVDLSSREFEQLVEHLYNAMEYDTELTPPRSDGGRDIIATKRGPGFSDMVYVECKRYMESNPVGVELVRALLGVVSHDSVNKGVLVTTSHFTRGACALAERDQRIELIRGRDLVVLLNEYLGHNWPARIDSLGRNRPFRSASPGTETNA